MIIFLYGADTFRSKEKLKGLKDRFIHEVDRSGFNLMELEGGKMNINDFNKAVLTQSFLSKKRMIIVRGIFSARKALQTDILELLKSKNLRDSSDENVIVLWDENADRRTALFKYLNGGKFVEEFKTLENSRLTDWIIGRVEKKGWQISRVNGNLLAGKSDGNLWSLAGEIDKMTAQKGDKEVSKQNIEESLLVKIDDNIFNLTDAIANKNKKLALQLIEDNLDAGVNEIYLLTMIVRQFRIIIQVKSALAAGLADSRQIAGKLGLHPFVVKKSMPQARLYSIEKLREIYGKLLEADLSLKSSYLSGRAALEKIVIEIAK
ncbi:MAG: DNA polymerase III subunit delta [Candidatus Kuenenbacteria bacterium]